MKKIKILHIIQGMNTGGAEILLKEIIQTLQRGNPEVLHVIAYINDGHVRKKIEERGIKCYHLKKYRFDRYNITQYFRLYRLIKTEKPSVIHSSLIHPITLGRIIGKITGTPIVGVHHGIHDYKYIAAAGSLYRALNKKTYHWASHYIGVNQSTKDLLLEKMPRLKEKNISVISNGIDTQAIINNSKNNRPSHDKNKTFNICAVSRLGTIKGVDLLLRAVKVLIESPEAKNQKISFTIMGDGSERENLKQLARNLNIDKFVSFWGDTKNPTQYLKDFDCFLHGSYAGCIGLAVMEAMAVGLPIVSTHITEKHEVVPTGEHLRISPVGDYKKLAENLLKTYKNYNYKSQERIRKYNQKLAREYFDIEITAQKYLDIFKQVIAEQNQR